MRCDLVCFRTVVLTNRKAWGPSEGAEHFSPVLESLSPAITFTRPRASYLNGRGAVAFASALGRDDEEWTGSETIHNPFSCRSAVAGSIVTRERRPLALVPGNLPKLCWIFKS